MGLLNYLFEPDEPDEERLKFLARVPMFENLMVSDVEFLLDELREVTVEPGDWVVRQGERGDGMYLIEDGEVEVVLDQEGEYQVVATMGKSEYFGEMSLINQKPRSASVRARSESTLLFLSERNFNRMVSGESSTASKIVFNIARELSDRLRDMNRQMLRDEGD